MTEIELIEQIALRVGMKSLMNNGAASCVYSEGCAGVTQDHLIAFTRQIALHCAVHLVGPAQTIPPSEQEGATAPTSPKP